MDKSQELMAAVTGAIWKCASSAENVERFQELGLIAVLIKILKENCDALDDLQFNPQKIDVLTNVVGAISGWLARHTNNSLVNYLAWQQIANIEGNLLPMSLFTYFAPTRQIRSNYVHVCIAI